MKINKDQFGENIILDTWDEVGKFADDRMSIPPSYLDKVNKRSAFWRRDYPTDAFSLGQLASKAWLLSKLSTVNPQKRPVTACMLGCWIGALVPMLLRDHTLERIYGLDIDPHTIQLAEEFNRQYVEDNWKFKGVVADVCTLNTNNMEFITSGELIQVKPDWVINTSCEHMGTDWFETADSDQLIIMQTNDTKEFDGHINVCYNAEEMQERYPLSRTLYSGTLKTPAYTRLMQLGYK